MSSRTDRRAHCAGKFHRRSRTDGLLVRGLLAAAIGLGVGQSMAQTAPSVEPDAQAMIEALRPPVTRGLRNLLVQPVAVTPEPAVPGGTPDAEPTVVPGASPRPVRPGNEGADLGQGSSPHPLEVTGDNGAAEVAQLPSISLAVRFDFDSARVRPESVRLLSNLAEAMRSPELAGRRFLLEGHTDGTGDPGYNLRLSRLRANQVRHFLVARGIDASRLAAVGMGSTTLVNHADPSAAENRRVRVVSVQ